LLFVGAAVSAGCDDVTSVELRLEYSQTMCGGIPVGDALFEQAGRIAVHVLEAGNDGNSVIDEQCFNVNAETARALPALPNLLESNVELAPIPFGTRVLVQLSVYDRMVDRACEPYDPTSQMDQAIPKYFGRTEPAVQISKDRERIPIVLRCL